MINRLKFFFLKVEEPFKKLWSTIYNIRKISWKLNFIRNKIKNFSHLNLKLKELYKTQFLRLVENFCTSVYHQLSRNTHAYEMSKCSTSYKTVSYHFFNMRQVIDKLLHIFKYFIIKYILSRHMYFLNAYLYSNHA